ncbi:hypothetical protein GOBAR_AA25773 [Gossypium barbadense]|uniref:Myb/SANT-like domain-containing protein n=1 Tax=Gossypium barbadense TaxID=3634 RepID=A0A2P5WUY3_GOSBA|nr:hypothetical protein GOBAR_AA25773 [Gossypium barbadense]
MTLSLAYGTVLSTLNERVRFELTKDHIRNRLKTWKKQYGTLRDLLSHPGFKWDRTWKMIIADDSVWTNYVKAHPEATTFRGRVIENYDNLCTIFANDNDVAEAVDIFPVQNSMKVKDQVKNMRWTYEMDQCLSKQFQLDLTKDHIRNRLKTWKKQYEILKGLLHHGDFEWDKTQTMVIANVSAWNRYIKRNPDARSFRRWIIRNYKELCAIFGSEDLPESSLNSSNDDLVEQVTLGNKLQKSFKQVALKAAVSIINKKFPFDLTTENIRNRLGTWKKKYRLVKDLLSQHGFEWDERQKTVIANDSEWRQCIKRNPDVSHIQGRAIDNFNELHVIVGNEQAGRHLSKAGDRVVNNIQNGKEAIEVPVQVMVDEDTCDNNTDDDKTSGGLLIHEKRARMFMKLDERLRIKWLLKRLRG